jgi:hypothetical protein
VAQSRSKVCRSTVNHGGRSPAGRLAGAHGRPDQANIGVSSAHEVPIAVALRFVVREAPASVLRRHVCGKVEREAAASCTRRAFVLMRGIIEGRGVRGAAWRSRQGEPDLTSLKRGTCRRAARGTHSALLHEEISHDQVGRGRVSSAPR